MSTTAQWFVGVAASLTAFGVIWQKAVRPVWRGYRRLHDGVDKIVEAAPTLFQIAEDFKANGGASLGDKLNRIEAAATAAAAAVPEVASKLAMRAEDTASKLAVKVAEGHGELIGLVHAIGDELHVHVEEDREAFAKIEEREGALPRIETVEQAAARTSLESPLPPRPEPDVP